MKVTGLTVVRNEADIIEAFVRHNIQFLDNLIVVDNGSDDDTEAILQALRSEGLPLLLRSDHRLEHPQEGITNDIVSSWEDPPDWLFLLDADEFIEPAEGISVPEVLEGLRPDVCYRMRWESFVPTAGDDPEEPDPATRIRHRVVEPGDPWLHKLLVPRRFLGSRDYVITAGNHMMLHAGPERRGLQGEPLPSIALGHFPVRSQAQIKAKALLGHWAVSSRAQRGPEECDHWAEMRQRALSGAEITPEELDGLARRYAFPEPVPELTLELAPLRHRPADGLRFQSTMPDWSDLAISFANTHFDMLRHRILDTGGNTRIAKTRFGPMIYNKHDFVIGKSLEEYGEWAGPEIQFLLARVKLGDVVLDVGANIGTHTIPLARAVGQQGRVFAFEPQRLSFQMLSGNLALNNLTNAIAYREALGSEPGVVTIPLLERGNLASVSSEDWGAGEPTLLRRVDDLELARIDLIKIDVEGMEIEVLKGARRTIRQHQPVLFVENNIPEKSAALIAEIHLLGYRCWWHMEPYFNPENYFGNAVNFFENAVDRPEFNMLCLPGKTEGPPDLEPVLDESDTGRAALLRNGMPAGSD